MHALHPNDLFAGRYRLRKQLGESAFSEAWLAYNEQAECEQVVKVYRSLDEQGCRAFREEYERYQSLMHSRLLRTTYFGVHEDRPYQVLPYRKRGDALRLAGKLSEVEIAKIMRDVGSALAYLHQPAYRLVHRDVKPGNILLSDQGHYLLSGLGLNPKLRREFRRHAGGKGIDISGDAGIAPPAYLAPECTGGDEEDNMTPASDIWALGATLYELAAGQPPGMAPAVLPPPFSLPLNNVLKHCMAKGPGSRPSAENLRQIAEEYLDTGQWPVWYSGKAGTGWKTGEWAGTRQPWFKRAGFMAALLAVLLAMAGIWAWPKVKNEDHLAGERQLAQDANTPQPEALLLPAEENEIPAEDTEAGGEEANKPAQEMPADTGRNNAQAKKSSTPPPADPVKTTKPPLPAPKAKDTAAGAQATKAATAPASEKTVEKDKPAKPPKDTGPEKETKALPQPRFNEVNQKWGYMDKAGNWAVWPQFEEAAPFKEGKAKVIKKEKNGELKAYYLYPDGRLTLFSEEDVAGNEND